MGAMFCFSKREENPGLGIAFYCLLALAVLLLGLLLKIFLWLVMSASLVGMIFFAKKQKTIPFAKNASIALLVVVVICAILIIFSNFGSGVNEGKINRNEGWYSQASVQILAENLTKKYPGTKVLIIRKEGAEQDGIVNTLRKYLGAGMEIVAAVTPDVNKPGPQGSTSGPQPPGPMQYPFEMLLKVEHFNELITKYSQCNLIISTIGIPRSDLEQMEIWKEENFEKRPAFALTNTSISHLKLLIKGSAINAAVTTNPTYKYDESNPPSKAQAAFDKRYLLVTPENVDEMETKYKIFSE